MKFKTLIILFLVSSCVRTEIMNIPEVRTVDTTKAQKPLPPPPPQVDTTRIPIGWNPSVGDWDETDYNL